MKKVLIITRFFPPFPTMGSIRLGGLAKYLPKFNWQPIILTAKLPQPPDPRFQVIETHYPGDVSSLIAKRLGLNPSRKLIDQVGLPMSIRSTKNKFISKMIDIIGGILIYPDEEKEWLPYGIEEGKKLLKTGGVEAMISSSPPVTAHLIASDLKKFSSLPWIADLRDPWSQNHIHYYDPVRRLRARSLETRTLSSADALVTVSEPLVKKLHLIHRVKHIVPIPNGFDPEEYIPTKLTNKFTITYTGRIHPRYYNVDLFLQALHNLIKANRIDPHETEVRFLGLNLFWLEQEIKKYKLDGVVHIQKQADRKAALQMQRESQVLLIFSWSDPKERGIYTGKLFEYLGARRPILSVGGHGEDVIEELLKATKNGSFAQDLATLEGLLAALYDQYKKNGFVPLDRDEEKVAQYSHIAMANRFADVLNTITT